jgi:hypothetical protein
MPHDDFKVEPIRGLPEVPPEGEHILWQGSPDWWALAKSALNAHWVAVYFAALALWRGWVIGTREGLAEGLVAASWYVVIGAVAVGVLALMAWVMARATVYTLTTHRVAMRIGAALTVTLNLPYRWIASADLSMGSGGTGTIVLDLKGDTRFSYLICWPHVRPWRIGRTQPALRCIPDARRVAGLLAEAAQARVSEIVVEPGVARPIAAE